MYSSTPRSNHPLSLPRDADVTTTTTTTTALSPHRNDDEDDDNSPNTTTTTTTTPSSVPKDLVKQRHEWIQRALLSSSSSLSPRNQHHQQEVVSSPSVSVRKEQWSAVTPREDGRSPSPSGIMVPPMSAEVESSSYMRENHPREEEVKDGNAIKKHRDDDDNSNPDEAQVETTTTSSKADPPITSNHMDDKLFLEPPGTTMTNQETEKNPTAPPPTTHKETMNAPIIHLDVVHHHSNPSTDRCSVDRDGMRAIDSSGIVLADDSITMEEEQENNHGGDTTTNNNNSNGSPRSIDPPARIISSSKEEDDDNTAELSSSNNRVAKAVSASPIIHSDKDDVVVDFNQHGGSKNPATTTKVCTNTTTIIVQGAEPAVVVMNDDDDLLPSTDATHTMDSSSAGIPEHHVIMTAPMAGKDDDKPVATNDNHEAEIISADKHDHLDEVPHPEEMTEQNVTEFKEEPDDVIETMNTDSNATAMKKNTIPRMLSSTGSATTDHVGTDPTAPMPTNFAKGIEHDSSPAVVQQAAPELVDVVASQKTTVQYPLETSSTPDLEESIKTLPESEVEEALNPPYNPGTDVLLKSEESKAPSPGVAAMENDSCFSSEPSMILKIEVLPTTADATVTSDIIVHGTNDTFDISVLTPDQRKSDLNSSPAPNLKYQPRLKCSDGSSTISNKMELNLDQERENETKPKENLIEECVERNKTIALQSMERGHFSMDETNLTQDSEPFEETANGDEIVSDKNNASMAPSEITVLLNVTQTLSVVTPKAGNITDANINLGATSVTKPPAQIFTLDEQEKTDLSEKELLNVVELASEVSSVHVAKESLNFTQSDLAGLHFASSSFAKNDAVTSLSKYVSTCTSSTSTNKQTDGPENPLRRREDDGSVISALSRTSISIDHARKNVDRLKKFKDELIKDLPEEVQKSISKDQDFARNEIVSVNSGLVSPRGQPYSKTKTSENPCQCLDACVVT
jgi:hypothetical protein